MSQAKARITNVTDEHIGCSRPTGLFLRRNTHKPDHLRWAIVSTDLIDDTMLQL